MHDILHVIFDGLHCVVCLGAKDAGVVPFEHRGDGVGTMKALLLDAYRHLEVVEMPMPTAGHGEVLVRVAACGVCGSDVHGYDGSSGRRIPPVVMGHEAAGTVAAVGEGVTGVAPGDRVTFDS